jgi:hypothetical protein
MHIRDITKDHLVLHRLPIHSVAANNQAFIETRGDRYLQTDEPLFGLKLPDIKDFLELNNGVMTIDCPGGDIPILKWDGDEDLQLEPTGQVLTDILPEYSPFPQAAKSGELSWAITNDVDDDRYQTSLLLLAPKNSDCITPRKSTEQ